MDVPEPVFVDVHLMEPDLALLDLGERIRDLRLPSADRLHLGAEQLDAAFERLEDLVLMACEAVVRQQAMGRVLVLAAAASAARSLRHRLPALRSFSRP